MANKFGGNPWMITKPADLPSEGHPDGLVFDVNMEHCQIELIAYEDEGTIAEVQDRDGKVVAHLKGLANGMTVRSGRIGWVNGLKIPVTTFNGEPNLKGGTDGAILVYYE